MNARAIVLDAFSAACASIDLASRVRAALGEQSEPVVVVAAGKAATAMMAGVENFSRALVIVPRGAAAPPNDARITVLEASHPLPDASSVHAAEGALALASLDSPHARLFLISGGASSLLCAPSITLERKRAVVDALLRAGESIDEINVVRRHLSRIKGGGLARACGARPRRTLIASDVMSNAAHVVGSGPSVEDPTTVADAQKIAARHGLGALPFVETWKHTETHAIIASPREFAVRLASVLSGLGLHAEFRPLRTMRVVASATHYASVATTLQRGEAAVFVSEPLVSVRAANARGGRCTHIATLMSSQLPEHVTFAAIATDGVDGSSGTAGAIVDAPVSGADFALASFATGPLHLAARTAIPSAPTGLNFADLHVLVR